MNCRTCLKDTDSTFDGVCPLCWMSDESNADSIGGDAIEALYMAFDVVAELKRDLAEARQIAEAMRDDIVTEGEIEEMKALRKKDPGWRPPSWNVDRLLETCRKLHKTVREVRKWGNEKVEEARTEAHKWRAPHVDRELGPDDTQRFPWE